MKNAIQYLLSKKNLTQQDLVSCTGYSKQYISKVVNRHFRVPVSLVNEITNLTGVPEDLFIDNTGLCRQLTSVDVLKIDNYLETQYFAEIEKELQYIPSQVELTSRAHALKLNIVKLQRSIRKDIHTVNKDISDQFSAMDVQESNLWFYEKILDLHKTCQLNDSEWESLFRAFNYAADNIAEEIVENDTPLVYGMYVLIKKSRELNAIKQHKLNRAYEELFGSLLDRFDDGDNA